MQILYLTFKLLTICGCWRPDSWTSLYKRIIYRIYSVVLVLLLNTFMLSQFLDLVLIVSTPDEFTDNFCILLAITISCYKLFSLLINRKNIALLINILMEKPCKPLESNEVMIQHRYDKGVQTNAMCYLYLGLTTCWCIVFVSLATNFRKGKLTYRAWLPFDYSSTILFCLMYTHQLISVMVGALLNIACDSLICGFLVHICSQIDILAYRLRHVASYSDIIRDCVRQHCHIFRFALIINTRFRLTVSVQFLMSTLVVCFSLYLLTKATTTIKYVEMTLYIACMLTQIFFYCWYGNEVKLKSRQLVDKIFGMEWLMLNKNVMKSLMIIMSRAEVPIEVTSAYIISVNLDSFMSLLKTSYSAYNLLQQMQ